MLKTTSFGGIHAAKGPATVGGQRVEMVVGCMAFNKATYKFSGAVPLPLAGPCGGKDAATDGCTVCHASGEGAAHSANQAFACV
ncbi:hypothetical protein XaplCFBP3123_14110 [Xanthomonas arboricola pv. populi]|nr:hypothetical protein XaplCFBP3123_14110 [Xanthomonas arboricola pv. populi]